MDSKYLQLSSSWKWNIPKSFNIGTDFTDKYAQIKTHSNKKHSFEKIKKN